MQIESITGLQLNAASSVGVDKSKAVHLIGEKQPVSPGTKQAGDASALPSDEVDVEKRAHALKEAIEPFNISLKFSRDADSGTMILQMIDQSTGETLRQIPDSLSLQLSATLGKLQGQIFSRKA